MGQDITDIEFTAEDFAEFEARLRAETDLLASWFADDCFADTPREAGFELEAWLVDRRHRAPAPVIEPLLDVLDDPLVVPELAQYNLELNGTPVDLTGDALSRLAAELEHTLAKVRDTAAGLDADVLTCGILPTLRADHMVMAQMTPRERYRALNEQILRLREGAPIWLAIHGEQPLTFEQRDVMLEAAATSFQIHIKMSAAESARVFNASKILSAPMVALASNSPFLFGRELWCETRIPLFEQAVSVGGSPLRERVGFGINYAEGTVLDAFRANIRRYPVLLPHLMDTPPEQLAHLRLHNGTIWRWNRPLIGFDTRPNQAPIPHLRMEHRVAAAGPTVLDNVANAAFYFGAVHALALAEEPPERRIAFPRVRANFYLAAEYGLNAEVAWEDTPRVPLSELIGERLLPLAHTGLADLGVDSAEREHWLDIVEQRVRTNRTGARWQRAWAARYGNDWEGLTEAYLERQLSGQPVHEWTLE
jgi:gamma-glutamyl:cysteine ligase YbdK (ATP-grasp superfamily)